MSLRFSFLIQLCFKIVYYGFILLYLWLYILDINPLSVASFANIFSHSIGCLFVLLMISFAMQELLSLVRSRLFILVFIFITLGDLPKKILLLFLLEDVLPIFSSKSLIVSDIIFRSLIHFEFIFVFISITPGGGS